MTIGEQLKRTEDQKTHERIARRSDILRKFVKEDLLAALKKDIEAGGKGEKAVLAPQEIRHLFQASLVSGGGTSIINSSGPYEPVWDELKSWMDSENLKLFIGVDMAKSYRMSTPWAEMDWGAYLYISIPQLEPELPTPPATQKVVQGATITMAEMLWGIGVSVLATFLLTYFAFGH